LAQLLGIRVTDLQDAARQAVSAEDDLGSPFPEENPFNASLMRCAIVAMKSGFACQLSTKRADGGCGNARSASSIGPRYPSVLMVEYWGASARPMTREMPSAAICCTASAMKGCSSASDADLMRDSPFALS
jgi:hypothetical protein